MELPERVAEVRPRLVERHMYEAAHTAVFFFKEIN